MLKKILIIYVYILCSFSSFRDRTCAFGVWGETNDKTKTNQSFFFLHLGRATIRKREREKSKPNRHTLPKKISISRVNTIYINTRIECIHLATKGHCLAKSQCSTYWLSIYRNLKNNAISLDLTITRIYWRHINGSSLW